MGSVPPGLTTDGTAETFDLAEPPPEVQRERESIPAAAASAVPREKREEGQGPKKRKKISTTGLKPPWQDRGFLLVGGGVVLLTVGAVLLMRSVVGRLEGVQRRAVAAAGTEEVHAFEPVAWKVPFGGTREDPAIPPDTVAASRGVILGPGPHYLVANTSDEFRQGRFDPDTREPIGEERILRRSHQVYARRTMGGIEYAAAASPGGRVALQTTDRSPPSIRVWGVEGETPEHELKLAMPDPATSGRDELSADRPWYWLGWAGEVFLYLDKGQLIGFDPAAKARLFAVGTEYQQPILVAPNGSWVIVSVGQRHLEVLDTKTGTCLGRFAGEGDWRQLVLSPDGKRLALVRYLGERIHATIRDFKVYVGDLKDGQVHRIRMGTIAGDAHWIGSDRIYLEGSPVSTVFDVSRGYETHAFYGSGGGGLLGVLSDGRLLFIAQPNAFDEKTRIFKTSTLDLPVGEPVIGPGLGSIVRVEVKSGSEMFDGIVVNRLEAALKEAGYKVGPGGWALAVDGTIGATGAVMEMKVGGTPAGQLQVPLFLGKLRLIGPDGQVFQTRAAGAQFRYSQSRYARSSEGPTSSPSYNFGVGNPAEAMLEEVAELTADGIVWSEWPPVVWKMKDNTVRGLPIATPEVQKLQAPSN